MWLLDHNIPLITRKILLEKQIPCEATKNLTWGRKRNGELVESAAANRFTAIITRDNLFKESASKNLKAFPQIAIVLVTLPQLKEKLFEEAFLMAWATSPIQPEAGKLIRWPT